jgi:hypothetical protein
LVRWRKVIFIQLKLNFNDFSHFFKACSSIQTEQYILLLILFFGDIFFISLVTLSRTSIFFNDSIVTPYLCYRFHFNWIHNRDRALFKSFLCPFLTTWPNSELFQRRKHIGTVSCYKQIKTDSEALFDLVMGHMFSQVQHA